MAKGLFRSADSSGFSQIKSIANENRLGAQIRFKARAAPWSHGAGAAKARDERSAKIAKREEMRSATGRAWKSWAL